MESDSCIYKETRKVQRLFKEKRRFVSTFPAEIYKSRMREKAGIY